jgi:site-specific DNA-adenine methylase
MSSILRVPCSYQGGKQRIASQIVDVILESLPSENTQFYDLCCGSGAISIELVNRGIDPKSISMLDISSWGTFWSAIGSNTFNMDIFDHLLAELPDSQKDFKKYLSELSEQPVDKNEAELYPILQACSFGGKQIYRKEKKWANACFRDYWEPTETSIRRSPANAMQPSPNELRRRVNAIVTKMSGVTCFNMDIMELLSTPLPKNSIVYIDPPYQNTTGYAYNFDLDLFIKRFREINNVPLFISEGTPLNEKAIMLNFGGANGGISGSRKNKHHEWLSRF